jgi:ankyrin repeat protein
MFKIHDNVITTICDLKKIVEKDTTILNNFEYKYEGNTYDLYMYVVMHGTPEMLEYLEKEHNWDIHARDNDGCDAYLIASYRGQLKVMKYLEKEHGWNIYTKNNYGDDAYLIASSGGQLKVMEYLEKEHRRDIYTKNNYGDDIKSHDTQIHGLMKLGQFNLVKSILEQLSKEDLADVINSIDQTGRTLLMHAAVLNNKDAAIWLLKNGIDTEKKDVMGKNALILAEIREHTEIVSLISKHKIEF